MRQSRILAFGVLGLLLALGGCAKKSFKDLAWTDDQIRTRDWTRLAPPRPQAANCYRTLAEIDCFDAPVPGAEHRRVAAQGDDSTGAR
jgi:hypothetical protein